MMTDYKAWKQAAPSYNTKIKEQINQKAKSDGRLFKDLGDNLFKIIWEFSFNA